MAQISQAVSGLKTAPPTSQPHAAKNGKLPLPKIPTGERASPSAPSAVKVRKPAPPPKPNVPPREAIFWNGNKDEGSR